MSKQNQTQEKDEIKYLNEMKKILGEDNYNNILNTSRTDENKFIDSVKRMIDILIEGGKKKDNISSSQLRNIFSRVRKASKPEELYILRPKLAYVYGRPNTKREMQKLIVLLDDQIQKVKNSNQLEMFKNFFESIIAYHKYFGGGN
jgi:CRISPR-associated protein Csm2